MILDRLLSDSELFDYCAITLDILLLEIAQQISSVTYHLEKTTTAVVILRVDLEVLGERVDAVRENRDLYLGRAGVVLVDAVFSNDLLLYFLLYHDFHLI